MAAGLLLLIAGVWLLAQSLVGDLPRRLLSWRSTVAEEGGDDDGQ
jgi:hypothetical protein